MTMMIGGRVAEEIIFGQLSTGAQNDLERITKTAYAMVVDFGMSERVGHVSFNVSRGRKDTPVFDKPYSETLAHIIDEEVKLLIDDVRQRAYAMLTERRDKLEELARVLLEREVLGPKELVDILGKRPYGEYVSYNGSTAQGDDSPAIPLGEEQGNGHVTNEATLPDEIVPEEPSDAASA